jgi:hypothetical protein
MDKAQKSSDSKWKSKGLHNDHWRSALWGLDEIEPGSLGGY